jgi:hypothetical protein
MVSTFDRKRFNAFLGISPRFASDQWAAPRVKRFIVGWLHFHCRLPLRQAHTRGTWRYENGLTGSPSVQRGGNQRLLPSNLNHRRVIFLELVPRRP